MKRPINIVPTVAALVGLTLHGYAVDIVNNTWLDGTRTDPAPPTYSENGVDGDFDGNIESAWFGSGTGASFTSSIGHLIGTPAAGSSASWTTYFSDTFANSVSLVNPGDMLKLTWSFTLTGVAAPNAGANFRLALVQTPNGGRVSTDATPANQIYAGYGMLGNMGVTLGRASGDNLPLMEWTVPGGANNILSTAAAYSKIAGDNSVTNNTGYADATPYTFVFTIQRTASGLQLDQTMTGGNLNGTGGLTNSFLDTTPSTFTFDTFAVRPSAGSTTASTFDTTLVRVEFIPVPEPSTIALAGLAVLGFVASYRRLRR